MLLRIIMLFVIGSSFLVKATSNFKLDFDKIEKRGYPGMIAQSYTYNWGKYTDINQWQVPSHRLSFFVNSESLGYMISFSDENLGFDDVDTFYLTLPAAIHRDKATSKIDLVVFIDVICAAINLPSKTFFNCGFYERSPYNIAHREGDLRAQMGVNLGGCFTCVENLDISLSIEPSSSLATNNPTDDPLLIFKVCGAEEGGSIADNCSSSKIDQTMLSYNSVICKSDPLEAENFNDCLEDHRNSSLPFKL